MRRIFIIAGIASLSISYLGVWLRFIKDPVERTGSDFIAFYSAGRVAQEAGLKNVYDPLLQQKVQQEVVGFNLVPGQVLLYNHMPFLLPVLQVIAGSDYIASFYKWVVLLVAIYLTGIAVLNQGLKRVDIDQNSILLSSIGGFLFLPLFFSLMNGQDTAILFLGMAIWAYGLISGKETLGGLGLSLSAVRPHIALVLAIPMFIRYRKVFWGAVIGSVILALLSVVLIGREGTQKFIDILFLSTGGEWYGMKENAMYNMIGLFTRLAPWIGAETIRSIGWAMYAMLIIGLCILWGRKRELHPGQIGLTIILALTFVPHLHFHDLAVLLIPVYLMIYSSKTIGLSTSQAVFLPLGISLLLLISNASHFFQFTVPYLIMAALAVYPYYAKSITAPHRS